MTPHEEHAAARAYFDERYEVLIRHPLVATRPIVLPADDSARRRCRFCGQDADQVSFSADAHAISNLLGNRSLFSPNECNDCNRRYGQKYEDHLGKWSNLARALAQIPGKKNKRPTFKSNDLRIESVDNGLSIHVPSPNSVDDLLAEGLPDIIELTGNTESQPHIPIRAAMALVKMACSVCPPEASAQCQNAIAWLAEKQGFRMSQFPVYFAFTPGPISDAASEAVLLRRKGDGAEPYLWLVVQFRNFRFQVFVPGCPADAHWAGEESTLPVSLKHYPSRFGPDWPFGLTKFSWSDWSGTQPVRTTASVSHKVVQLIGITRPGEQPDAQPDTE
jgi:hypothetical protein